MSNPAHKELGQKLSAFVDGELSVEERKQIEQLLANDKAAAGLVADLRAGSGLLRLTYEAKADEEDFKDFANQVLAKVTPQKLPFFERLTLSLSETFKYQRPMLMTAMATAMALIVAVPVGIKLMEPQAGYGSKDVEVQSVAVSSEGAVRPIVYENDKGDAIIWTVEQPGQEDTAGQQKKKTDEKTEELDVDPSTTEKKAGEL